LTALPSRDRFLIEEMTRHLAVMKDLTKDGKESLERSVTQRYALEHACELLAEAAKHTSREFRTLNPDISWEAIRGLRTALAHPYDQGASPAKLKRLWEFALEECPRLAGQLGRVRYGRSPT
jgi:uncharacterized protein with HEPN domain